MTPNRREFEKQCTFQKFCKSVLHNEACNAHEEIRRRRVQIPLHRITDSASNGSVFPVVTEHFSASSDHAFL